VVLLVLAGAAATVALAEEKPVWQRLNEAHAAARKAEQQEQAIALCEGVLADAEATVDQKVDAAETIAGIYRDAKRTDEAVAAARQVAAVAPDDVKVREKAINLETDILDRAKRPADAVARLKAYAEAEPDKPAAARALIRAADFLRRTNEHDAAADVARQAVARAAEADDVAAQALDRLSDALLAASRTEDGLKATQQLLQPRYLGTFHRDQQRGIHWRYGEILKRLERRDEARRHFEALAKAEQADAAGTPGRAAEYAKYAADIAWDAQKFEDALKAYERIFLDHPESADVWYDAQMRIAEGLLRLNRPQDALGAARIALDGATDENRALGAMRFIAEAMKNIDGHLGRANAFINYQRFGPAGEDAQAGTADDLADPLAAVPRPSYPEREKVFEASRARAGDNAEAMRYRAMTYLYAGRPVQALRCAMDAFARCTGSDVQTYAELMILVGARAVRGHAADMEPFYAFVNYGPAGPDGKAGTADDLADPFAPLLK
jgi:tetratricopeptide (TPR) repeat protein